MLENYYKPEQKDLLEARRYLISKERRWQLETEWQDLVDRVRAEVEKVGDPASEPVQKLAQQWLEWVELFRGEDMCVASDAKQSYPAERSEIDVSRLLEQVEIDEINKAIGELPSTWWNLSS